MKASSNFPVVSFFAFIRAFACGSEKYLESVSQRHPRGFRKGLQYEVRKIRYLSVLQQNLYKMEEIICGVVDLSPHLSNCWQPAACPLQ